MLETWMLNNLDCRHPCKRSFTRLLLSALQEWFLCWKHPETFRGRDKNTFLQSACILSFWKISLLLLNSDCQITFKDHFTCPQRQHCSQGMFGSSSAGQQVTFQYYFIVCGPLQWVLEFVGGGHPQPHLTVPSTKELGMLSKCLPWWNSEETTGENIIR